MIHEKFSLNNCNFGEIRENILLEESLELIFSKNLIIVLPALQKSPLKLRLHQKFLPLGFLRRF